MLKQIVLLLISLYQGTLRLSIPGFCRFTPSCSDYAKEAITRYGVLHGGWKAALRIVSCHPLSRKAGYDPLL